MSSPNFATDAPRVSSTPRDEVNRAVDRLASKKNEWVRVSIEKRKHYLMRCIDRTLECADDWVRASCRAKGIDPNSPRAGEEWLGGPMATVRNMRLLAEAVHAGGRPAPERLTKRASGQWVAQTFPSGVWESLMYAGFHGEVWIQPGKEPTQGHIYRMKQRGEYGEGKVALVLGAGNVSSIGPMDALHKLFVEDEVVVVKMNPVNAYLQPYWEEAFRPLVDDGFVAIVRGGAEIGNHLVHHPKVDTLHMTGSDRTHDAILWGSTPEEQARRKKSGQMLVDKPITSELGAVTPVFVVPGRWKESDIAFQARHVAGMVANNGSFNCNAAKALVTATGWAQRDDFLTAVEKTLEGIPQRTAYYPGAQQRYDGFLAKYPNAKALGPRSKDVVPWTIIPDVPAKKGEYALTNEAFCGVLAETALDASDAKGFLEQMVSFANDACWGTLSCMILIDDDTKKTYAAELDRAIEKMRYGGIGVNVWAGVIYASVSSSWGAFPGHPLTDIQSGRGVVHNTFMFDHPERTVLSAPFRIKPTPAWFPDHKTGHILGPALTRFEAAPGPLRLAQVLAAALRG